MNRIDGEFLSVDDALHVHQARAVCSSDVFGAGLGMMTDLIFGHTDRYGLLVDGEHASETAAFVYVFGFHHFDAFYHLQ